MPARLPGHCRIGGRQHPGRPGDRRAAKRAIQLRMAVCHGWDGARFRLGRGERALAGRAVRALEIDICSRQTAARLTRSAVQAGGLMILIVDIAPDRRPATGTAEMRLAHLAVAPRCPPVPVAHSAPAFAACRRHTRRWHNLCQHVGRRLRRCCAVSPRRWVALGRITARSRVCQTLAISRATMGRSVSTIKPKERLCHRMLTN